ncbi:Gfo/Idh/MocA family protein [Sinomicrobium weinanense]|uniref:Gfo/Idh/MocA family oxidoreductase n=1 Tax=Sinomicrobium weinanense TaxID=2842200 RepID=A0A926Q0T5_9FLAO|nr:Gfo/Idh/MocA family oxidoreductase [Sinomicrobium weinanense]MBC9795217.1 Gfo/Idh/MocA family oxidoreductase [Sinomicrobium weinanense]MBU3121994.1 Gfo/Idh/MocA family oxidoreductase [Sinomicrobium weinanense]
MHRTKIGFGIIGTGAIASHHVKSIRELEDCKLVAVCSSTPERAEEASEKFGVPAYFNLDDFLLREDIDIVSVCTQSGKHMEPIIAAARAGKHIITEKPLEVSPERANRIISVCRSQGVKLCVIFQNRFNPAYLRLKQAVDQGALGRLILGNAYIKWYRDGEYYKSSNWKGTLKGDGGAALINQGIHTIDLLLDIMKDVKSVFGKVKTMVHDIQGEDIGIAMLEFKNGAVGTIEGSTALYPGYKERLEIYGEKGSIVYEGGKIVRWDLKNGENIAKDFTENSSSGASDPMSVDYRLHMAQIKEMVYAVCNDREPLVHGETAMKSLELISAIYKSSDEEKIIKFK